MRSTSGLVLCVLVLGACGPRMIGDPDAGADASVPIDDAGEVDGFVPMPDGGGVDGGGVDGGPPPTGPSEPSPPATVSRAGTGGFLLRGVVLAPTGPIDPGEVLIVGDTITCVAPSCAGMASADTVTVIETNGVISPGLIDAHNHLTYNFLPEWVAGTTFDSRDVWRDDPGYEAHVAPYSDNRNANTHVCPAAKWGELRSIIHGTTTVQGQSFNRSCLDRLARNADHHHGLGADHMQTTIAGVRDITSSAAATVAANFGDGSTTRYAVHMQEGIAGNILLEFESYAGRDTRSNRHMGLSLLEFDGTWSEGSSSFSGSYSGTAMLIHCMSVTPAQITEIVDTGSHVVWSPSSNLILYGETAPIAELLAAGAQVGLGPDWTPSGEDEMLSEMRFGYAYGQAESIAALTPRRMWEMATSGSATAVGLEDSLGSLEVGRPADVTVFGRRGADPYRAVLDSRAQDVRLVYIDGLGYYGDLALEPAASLNGECDMLDACGSMKFLCAANTPGASDATASETVDDVRQQLVNILAGYGRESELLELVSCD